MQTRCVGLLLLVGGWSACDDAKSLRPRILVAASFQDAASRVVGDAAIVVPSSSSTLARQIVAGAPAECFISADVDWMDYLAERELLQAGSRQELVRNAIVVVAPKGRPGTVSLATFKGTIAMGDPEHVPAGKYARRALEAEGLWRGLSGSIVPTGDVRQALVLVERNEVDLGIVYETDAEASSRVLIVHRFAEGKTPAVRYEIAIVRDGDPAFLRMLTSDSARKVYRELGFRPVSR
jgi:molybdate transport system substrate-binding protein